MNHSVWNSIIEAILALQWTEAGAVVFGLIYVILAARKNYWCWYFGIVSCALWAYATFAYYQLYFDAILNIFYVIMGFWGLYQWKFGNDHQIEKPISSLGWNQNLKYIILGVLIALPFGYFFAAYTQAASTYLDSVTTVFAIVATFLTVYKILENWLYWIVVDILYVYLYITREAWLFALIFIIYIIIAIDGYISWRREYQKIKT